MDDITDDFENMLSFCFEDLEDPRVQTSCDHLRSRRLNGHGNVWQTSARLTQDFPRTA